MIPSTTSPWSLRLLNQAPLILFGLVLLVFGVLSPAFLQAENALNILTWLHAISVAASACVSLKPGR